MQDVRTVDGEGLRTQRQVKALESTRKYFSRDRCQTTTLSTGLHVEFTIHSSSDEPEDETLPEERVVLITGFMMTKEGWAPMLDILLSKWHSKTQHKKLKVLTFDNRGSGGSDKPWSRYTTSQMAQDTLSLMSHVGWDSAHIFGGSMGGMIAIELASSAPERVRSLSLMVTTRGKYLPHPRMWKPFLGSVLGGSMSCILELLYPTSILNNPIDGCQDVKVQSVLTKYHATKVSDHDYPPLHALIAQGVACLTHFVSDERLKAIAQSGFPVLVVGAMQDILIPPENSVALAERLKGDNVETLFFEEAGHGVFFQFAEEVADGLASTIKRAKL